MIQYDSQNDGNLYIADCVAQNFDFGGSTLEKKENVATIQDCMSYCKFVKIKPYFGNHFKCFSTLKYKQNSKFALKLTIL